MFHTICIIIIEVKRITLIGAFVGTGYEYGNIYSLFLYLISNWFESKFYFRQLTSKLDFGGGILTEGKFGEVGESIIGIALWGYKIWISEAICQKMKLAAVRADFRQCAHAISLSTKLHNLFLILTCAYAHACYSRIRQMLAALGGRYSRNQAYVSSFRRPILAESGLC
jgi:hypothetical protein